MDALTVQPAAAGAAACGVVDREIRCVRCGYELRGLPVTGMCPECGGEIRRTLLGDLLVFSDARYVRTLRVGASLALAGIVAALVTVYGGVGMLVWMMVRGSGGPGLILGMGGAGALVFAVLSLLGWWLLSAPDPGRLGADSGVTARKVVRAGVALTAAGWMGLALMRLVMSGLLVGSIMSPIMGAYLMDVAMAAGWLGVLVQLLGSSAYMVSTSARVRSAEIAKAARDVRNLTIATACAAGVTLGVAFVMRSTLAAVPGIVAYGCFAVTAGRYASVVAMARREIKLAEAVIRSEARAPSQG